MTGFDYAVAGIIFLSGLLGWWRGLVYEVLSLLGWLAAYMVAQQFAARIAPLMPEISGGGEAIKLTLAFITLFVLTLVAAGFVAWILSKLVKWVGLAWMDSSLGILFGIIRGGLLVLILVALAGLSNFPEQAYWRDAFLSRPLENIVLSGKERLPQSVAQRLHYRNQT